MEGSYWNSDGGNKAVVGRRGKGHVRRSAQARRTGRAEMEVVQLSLPALRDQTKLFSDLMEGGKETSFS